MVSTSVKRQAARDAKEYAAAKMFYGEGAGVRRRLIEGTVQYKITNLKGYDLAYEKALQSQDYAKLAKKATRDRRTIDAKDAVMKNGRAIVRGDYRAMSLPLLAVAATAYVAHQTGYDKKALAYSKRKYGDTKRWVARKKAEHKRRNDPPEAPTVLGATGPV